jgi:DNA-directed RNA polymerase subunit F
VNLLGGVLHDIEEAEEKQKLLKPKNIPIMFASDLDKTKPEDGRMLLDELTKTLHLNNEDPQKYNLEYFARYFNIQPENLKNIFNYVGYPVVDEATAKVIKIYRFTHK